jgi:hypothetical protein
LSGDPGKGAAKNPSKNLVPVGRTGGVNGHPYAFPIPLHAPARQPLRPPARRPLARRRRGGFTLAEVTLATAILAAAITTSIGVIQWGMRHLDLARGTTLAAQILQSEIERIRMMGWDRILALPAEATVPLREAFSSESGIAQGFTLTRSVAPDNLRPDDLRRITVTVRWTTTDRIAHSRSFRATYAKNGINDYYYTLSNP